MTSLSIKLPPDIGKFITKHFEKVSLIYHIVFLLFLGYLVYIRPPDVVIPPLFIHLLGAYVMIYGSTIFLFGPRIINHIKIY